MDINLPKGKYKNDDMVIINRDFTNITELISETNQKIDDNDQQMIINRRQIRLPRF